MPGKTRTRTQCIIHTILALNPSIVAVTKPHQARLNLSISPPLPPSSFPFIFKFAFALAFPLLRILCPLPPSIPDAEAATSPSNLLLKSSYLSRSAALPLPLPPLPAPLLRSRSPTTHAGTRNPVLDGDRPGSSSVRHATPTIQPITDGRSMAGNWERASWAAMR